MNHKKELRIPERILMGPGPSNVSPGVLNAMASPLLGHLDPVFLEIMNDNMEFLRQIFATQNQLTIPMSGTGSAGMETAFVNVIEPDDTVIVCVAGVFGQRMTDVAARCRANVVIVEAAWGEAVAPEQVEAALKQNGNVKAVAIVHAETSTGVWQPLEEIAKLTHEHGALFIVDAVTSLGGVAVDVDKTNIDVCYSGTQKCISAPPGLAPVTLNARAAKALQARKSKVQSWYLDLSMIQNYWGSERLYHHTAPISMNYALREALRSIINEGIDNCHARHLILGKALHSGLEAMGLKLQVAVNIRLPQLTTVVIPDGIDDAAVRQELLSDFGIEIGSGLGVFKGKVWRVGLMGQTCKINNVIIFLSALETILSRRNAKINPGEALQAAMQAIK